MYAIANEKLLRLVYETFNLAILAYFSTFYEIVNLAPGNTSPQF